MSDDPNELQDSRIKELLTKMAKVDVTRSEEHFWAIQAVYATIAALRLYKGQVPEEHLATLAALNANLDKLIE